MSKRSCPRSSAAFSLVEVALAVGVLSFAMVAILGLLSVGINASRDSGDDTKVGFIMQDVASRVRSEVTSVNLPTDATKLDLTWNSAFNGKMDYAILGNTSLPTDATGQPQAAANAYYTQDGLLVRQTTATAPTPNFYKASIFVQPFAVAPSPYPFPTPTPASSPYDYPFLVVTVKVGWPTDTNVNGNVVSAGSAAKAAFTFYLPKP